MPALGNVDEPEPRDVAGAGLGDVLAVELMVPALARTSAEMVFSVVVLPAPLAPSSVTIWPRRTSRSMPFTAWMRP